ncbi:MAG TPA: ABC transporter permease [Phycisphaerae bacterium]|nr:ABC transporter permease [Phycisphaerales bacterium]HRX87288.1 ABC transporter permease [Phycisphaerae bacterium]
MHKILDVAVREYNAAVRTKAFIISIVLMPILMGGGVIAHKLLRNQVDITTKQIAVVDRSGIMADVLVRSAAVYNESEINDPETGKQIKPKIEIEVVKPAEGDAADQQRIELSDRVRGNKLEAWVEIGANIVHPGDDDGAGAMVAYHSKGAVMDEQRKWIAIQVNNQVQGLRMADAQISPVTIQKLIAPVPVEGLGLVSIDTATGEIEAAKKTNETATVLVPLAMMMLMFMMISMGATPLLNSVLEEKMQRIAEVLLGSLTPFQLMMGKLLGTIGVALTVAVIYFVGGAITIERMHATEYIPLGILPWFFAYLTASIFMFGAMFVAIGSACNDLKEAQSLMMPVWLVVCAPLFVWLQVVKQPTSDFSTAMSLFPPCTPMLMVLRQTTPTGVPAWQPWAGLAGVLICTLIAVWIAGRIFRVGLLMQGKPPKLGELFRWALAK